MRLTVVSPFVDRRHGTERALAELLERLCRNYGCGIRLYTQRLEDLSLNNPGSMQAPGSGAILWHKVPAIPGPHVVQFLGWMFLNGFLRKWHALFRGVSYDLLLSPGINCLHPDVVIVHVLFHRLQELADEESQDASTGFYRRMHRRLYYGLLCALERRIYSDARVSLAAVSQRMADLMKDYFGREDVCVIANGVDTEHFSSLARLARRGAARQHRQFREDELVLLLIGNDWRVKGLPTVLEAMALLAELPLRLLVIGNDVSEPFRERARQLGVLERCQWEAPKPDVLDFYAGADLYVSPSREDSFGLPVAEAMACGLPVITSAFAGVSELIHNGIDGFILREPQDVTRLAELIRCLHTDAGMRRNIGEAAARAIPTWSWDRHAASVWGLLKNAAARGASCRASE